MPIIKITCINKFIALDTEKMEQFAKEERNIREENLRLQRKLQMEVERREALCRHLSESESRYLSFCAPKAYVADLCVSNM